MQTEMSSLFVFFVSSSMLINRAKRTLSLYQIDMASLLAFVLRELSYKPVAPSFPSKLQIFLAVDFINNTENP
jgi:hypothetical protein